MAVDVRKKEGENPASLINRFLRRVQRSGVLKESKKRRVYSRPVSRLKRKLSALNRETKKREIIRARKLGLL